MKKGLLILLSATVLVLLIAFCNGAPEPYKIDGTIIGVQPQHDTRVFILYKEKNGKTVERSTHQSERVTDGTTTINPRDYLSTYCKEDCQYFYKFEYK